MSIQPQKRTWILSGHSNATILQIDDGIRLTGNVTLGSNLVSSDRRVIINSSGNITDASILPPIPATNLTGTLPSTLFSDSSIPANAVQGLVQYMLSGGGSNSSFSNVIISGPQTWSTNGSIVYTLSNVGIGMANPDPRFTLQVAGNMCTTGDVLAMSDRRLKDDLLPIGSALEKIRGLTGYTYFRNDLMDDKRRAGVIAQDVEKVFPEAVMDLESGYKSVAYPNLIALLIQGIKELDSKLRA
jgi:hypothetical protein